ncbi:hypothetical protein L486_05775 [Kwoniella mangroviensis CBS 10435]|uniref:Uncharacterized protein n=1 Tax=Kwoniella mangroviensis CBS 10435 TaxID=1331196 RepID=A0A1B9IMW9_9TREE|nr:hypothetical protein L486_05775 [Kwoniella mangroviensis CBS 10435]
MNLTVTQKTVIVILAIFLTFIAILFLFCIYSSRKARRDTIQAQKAVLGRWKENPGGLEEGTLPNLSVPSVHTPSHRNEYDLATLPGSNGSAREEKRGSGLAGIGTFSASKPRSNSHSSSTGNSRPVVQSSQPSAMGVKEMGQPRKNPIPTLSRPMSWSRGISRTRSRSISTLKSNVSDRSIFKPNKSRYFINYMNPPPPPIPRKSSARSSGSNGSAGAVTGARLVDKGDRRGGRR